MEILLHKVCGRPASRTMTLRAAGPEDAAAFYALQNEVRAAMPHPEQFVPDTLENIARYLKEDLCIGGWDGGRLGAYFILRYCGQDAHNYAAFMGIPREEWDGWANADSAIVHPDYRGNGLQRKLLEAALARLRPGIGCGSQRLLRCCLHPAGRSPNISSLFPPLAAVVAVAPKGRGTGVSVKPMLHE